MIENEIFNCLNIYIDAKDKFGKYLYCNENVAAASGLDSPSQIVGKTDHNLIWRKYADLYVSGDLAAINGLPFLNVLEPLPVIQGVKKILVSKSPLLNKQDKCIGVVGSYIDVTNYLIKQKQIALTIDDRKIYLGKRFNNEYLTMREADVLKGILTGYSAKQIAKILNISHRTVETHIKSLRLKLQSHSIGDIINTAIRTGLNYSILDLDFVDCRKQ